MKRATKQSPTKKSATSRASAKRSSSAKGRAKGRSSTLTKQVKSTAMKVFAGAASGAVQALIPPLEEAAGRSAKAAGTSSAKAPRTSKGTRRAKSEART